MLYIINKNITQLYLWEVKSSKKERKFFIFLFVINKGQGKEVVMKLKVKMKQLFAAVLAICLVLQMTAGITAIAANEQAVFGV